MRSRVIIACEGGGGFHLLLGSGMVALLFQQTAELCMHLERGGIG